MGCVALAPALKVSPPTLKPPFAPSWKPPSTVAAENDAPASAGAVTNLPRPTSARLRPPKSATPRVPASPSLSTARTRKPDGVSVNGPSGTDWPSPGWAVAAAAASGSVSATVCVSALPAKSGSAAPEVTALTPVAQVNGESVPPVSVTEPPPSSVNSGTNAAAPTGVRPTSNVSAESYLVPPAAADVVKLPGMSNRSPDTSTNAGTTRSSRAVTRSDVEIGRRGRARTERTSERTE